MSNEPNDTNETTETEGEYNPSGGVPSHPADPQYGTGDESDDDTEDTDTPA